MGAKMPATGGLSEPGEVIPSIQETTVIRPENPRYELYLAGWARGFESRQAEVDRLNALADRIWAEMCRRPGVPFIEPQRPSYADLERIRGNTAHADLIDTQNAVRFSEVTR